MANRPLILTDNIFDATVLHPDSLLSSVADEAAYHETFRVADNLRDLTHWTPTATNAERYITVDAGAAVEATCLILERGHNLAGITCTLTTSSNNFSTTDTTPVNANIPAAAGGLPTDANGCRTLEGAVWWTFASTTKRYWRFTVPAMGAGIAPIITGLHLGLAYRFPEHLDAPGAYDYRSSVRYRKNETSEGAVRVKSRPQVFDELDLRLQLEGTDYANFHTEVSRLIRSNHPWWFCHDDSVTANAQLMRVFQLAGDFTYDPVAAPVHRVINIPLEQVIPEVLL